MPQAERLGTLVVLPRLAELALDVLAVEEVPEDELVLDQHLLGHHEGERPLDGVGEREEIEADQVAVRLGRRGN